MTRRRPGERATGGQEFLPVLDELIVAFCRRLLSSRKAITTADLTKLLDIRIQIGGPVSQQSEIWKLIEKIRLEKGGAAGVPTGGDPGTTGVSRKRVSK